MEELEGQVKYLKQYIQRQENLLLDYIRKTLDFELKNLILNASLQETSLKYDESQKQVEIQNELMQQAATGVESLTIENKLFEQKEIEYTKTIEDLKKALHDCKTEREIVFKKYNDLKTEHENFDKKYNDLMTEYKRQTEELSKPIINKRNKKQSVILPPDEF